MSIKDVKKYYDQVEQQFFEMNQAAKELNEECALGNIPKEMVEQAEAMALPLRQNYERLSYLIYLLNMPNKKEKKFWYNNQNKKLVNDFKLLNADQEAQLQENILSLSKFKEFVNKLKED